MGGHVLLDWGVMSDLTVHICMSPEVMWPWGSHLRSCGGSCCVLLVGRSVDWFCIVISAESAKNEISFKVSHRFNDGGHVMGDHLLVMGVL